MPKQYPKELRERAVRLVAEHRGDYEQAYNDAYDNYGITHDDIGDQAS